MNVKMEKKHLSLIATQKHQLQEKPVMILFYDCETNKNPMLLQMHINYHKLYWDILEWCNE